MSVLNGTLVRADTKTSKKGNPYHRLQIQGEDGTDNWYTYFGVLHGNYTGAQCVFALKQGKSRDGYPADWMVEEYNIVSDGQAPVAQAPASTPASVPGVASAGPAKVGGHKEMWIFAECIYQHNLNNWTPSADEPSYDVKEIVAESLSAAIFANEVFKKYDTEGAQAARTLIQSAYKGSPAARVAEMQEQATQGESEINPPPQDFDDDIPF